MQAFFWEYVKTFASAENRRVNLLCLTILFGADKKPLTVFLQAVKFLFIFGFNN